MLRLWLAILSELTVQVLFHTLGIIMPETAATEAALQALIAMARRNMSSVPVALAIATACVKQGQIPRARNQLKRIHVCSTALHPLSLFISSAPLSSLASDRIIPEHVCWKAADHP